MVGNILDRQLACFRETMSNIAGGEQEILVVNAGSNVTLLLPLNFLPDAMSCKLDGANCSRYNELPFSDHAICSSDKDNKEISRLRKALRRQIRNGPHDIFASY